MGFAVQSAAADSIYTFMQFNCDESKNTLEIKEVYATDYPEFKSLDEEPGIIKDLDIEYIRTKGITAVKEGQLPKSIANCNLQNSNKGTIELTLSLTEVHLGKLRGLCAAASGAAYEVLLDSKAIARFPSKKDDCLPRLNPLNIDHMKYSGGRIGLCRIPDNSSSNIQNLSVRFEGELCLYGTPEVIANNQEVMKDFEQEVFDNLALYEAKRELHVYKKQKSSADIKELSQLNATSKEQQEEIIRLREELQQTKSNLKAEESKSFWKRLLNKTD